METKLVGIYLSKEHIRKLDLIAKGEYSDKSKIIRKWIDENYKEEYEKK